LNFPFWREKKGIFQNDGFLMKISAKNIEFCVVCALHFFLFLLLLEFKKEDEDACRVRTFLRKSTFSRQSGTFFGE